MAGLFDFLIDRVYNGDDEAYKLLAAVQLFFQQSNKKVKQALSDLERDNNELYLDGQEKFLLILEKPNSDIKPIHEKKAKRGPDLAER